MELLFGNTGRLRIQQRSHIEGLCDMTTLFVVGGTWELQQWGLCEPIVYQAPIHWRTVWIKYPAAYGNKVAFKDSVAIGNENLNEAIESCNDDYVVLGY